MYYWPALRKNCTIACLSILLKLYLKILLKWCLFVYEAASDVRTFSYYQGLTTQTQCSDLNYVLSDLDSVFIGFIPHCVEQQWPCGLSVIKDKYSIKSKNKNKVNSDSKLNLNEFNFSEN